MHWLLYYRELHHERIKHQTKMQMNWLRKKSSNCSADISCKKLKMKKKKWIWYDELKLTKQWIIIPFFTNALHWPYNTAVEVAAEKGQPYAFLLQPINISQQLRQPFTHFSISDYWQQFCAASEKLFILDLWFFPSKHSHGTCFGLSLDI